MSTLTLTVSNVFQVRCVIGDPVRITGNAWTTTTATSTACVTLRIRALCAKSRPTWRRARWTLVWVMGRAVCRPSPPIGPNASVPLGSAAPAVKSTSTNASPVLVLMEALALMAIIRILVCAAVQGMYSKHRVWRIVYSIPYYQQKRNSNLN